MARQTRMLPCALWHAASHIVFFSDGCARMYLDVPRCTWKVPGCTWMYLGPQVHPGTFQVHQVHPGTSRYIPGTSRHIQVHSGTTIRNKNMCEAACHKAHGSILLWRAMHLDMLHQILCPADALLPERILPPNVVQPKHPDLTQRKLFRIWNVSIRAIDLHI